VAKPAPKKAVPAKTASKVKAVAKPAAKPATKVAAKPADKKKAVSEKVVAAKKVVVKPTPEVPVKSVKTATPSVKAAATVKKEVSKPVAAPVATPAPVPAPPKPKAADVKVEVKTPAPIPRPTPKKVEPLKEVKVPKISVKTSVPYQPEYRPLEQRDNNFKSNEPLVRYSDSDLKDFRDLINKKLDAAKQELAYLQGLITRKDEMGGDETENRYMTMEDGSMSMEREQLSQMASRQITYIDHLEKALIRIENKTYGICRVTGKLIDKARLRAVPHATLSLEAKLGLVKPSSDQ
jgi:RNA polymerase-binding transcription factor DksA